MSTRSRKRDLDRCDARRNVNGHLVPCGQPATWLLTVTERPGAHLHPDTIDWYCGPQGRCDEHAQPFIAGDWIMSHVLKFEIQPRSES